MLILSRILIIFGYTMLLFMYICRPTQLLGQIFHLYLLKIQNFQCDSDKGSTEQKTHAT